MRNKFYLQILKHFCSFGKEFFRNLVLIIENVRDLFIRFIPAFIVRPVVGHGEFAFIVHPRDLSDAKRKYPFAAYLPKAFIEVWSRHQWPTIGSKIKGLVDKNGNRADGWVIICPMTTRLMIRNRNLARKRIFQSVRLAEKLGVRLAGLGAFTSILTHDGRSLLGKTKIGFTTGNAYSAAVAIENLESLLSLTGRKTEDCTIAIVGGAGSVGSACSKILARKSKNLIIVDKNKQQLTNLLSYINMDEKVRGATEIASIKDADGVIVVTSAPGTIVRASHLKKGAVVIDAAQPKNVSKHVPRQRRDVVVVESAITKIPFDIDFGFDFGLEDGEAFGCMAEVILLTWAGHKGNYSIGKASSGDVEEILQIGKTAGFRLAEFRNSCGRIPADQIKKYT